MKKLLSIVLSVAMILAIAVPVLAASSTTGGNFKVGTVYYDDFLEAINAAEAGSTITMTKDVTVACDVMNKFAFTKSLTVDGGGYTLAFTCAANIFPIVVNNDSAVVEFTNFKNIKSDGGIFAVTTGTLKLTDLTATGKGRATAKTQVDGGTSNIIVENATLTFDSSAAASETTMIVTGSNANDTITLKNGAVIEKTNKANNAANAAAAAIYFMNNNSTQKLIMESGSKIIGKHASGGNTTASIIGNVGTGTNVTVQIASGAYLINESSNTANLNFICNSSEKNLTLTAPDGAFLVKSGLTPTILDYQGGANDGGNVYNFTKLASSAVSGYDAYKMTVDPTSVKYFEFTNDSGAAVKTGSLASAIAGAKSGSTIKLLSDYLCTESGLAFPGGKTLTLNLQKHSLFVDVDAYFFSTVSGNFTIKNGTLELRRGLSIVNGGVLTFDSVTANVIPTAAGARPLVKLSGDSSGNTVSTTKLVVRDSALKTTATGEALILVEHFTKGTIELIGNTTVSHEGTLNGNNQNNGVICVQNGGNLNLGVGNSATIRAAHKAAASDVAERASSCIADQTKGDIEITFYNGATLYLDREASLADSMFYNTMNAEGTFVINNNGVNYTMSAVVAKAGVTLPAAERGYIYNGEVFNGTEFVDENATTAVTVNEIILRVGEIKMEKGAAIRTVLPFGLNFAATVSKEFYAQIKDTDPNAKFGFVIATTRKGGNLGMNVEEMNKQDYIIVEPANIVENEDGSIFFDKTVYIGEDSFIASADKTGFKTAISARAYVVINGETYYADYNQTDNSRSIYDVAKAYYEDTVNGSTTNLVINHILETCGYSF